MIPGHSAPGLNDTSDTSITVRHLSRYANIRDKDLRKEGFFICEGRNLVLRHLSSRLTAESVLCVPSFADELREAAGDTCPVYVKDQEYLIDITGFPFHRGVLSCGIREPLPPAKTLPEYLPQARTLVILPDINNQENLGGIIRSAVALGADAVVLGDRCADPFGRKALKASMGTIFHLPLFSSSGPDDVAELGKAGFSLLAAVTHRDAVPVHAYHRPGKAAILIGGEAAGLSSPWLDICSVRLTIPMKEGVDSLNAATSAGILLYGLANR